MISCKELNTHSQKLQKVTANHAIQYNVTTYLLAWKFVNFFDVVGLNDCSKNSGAKHDEIGLENSI